MATQATLKKTARARIKSARILLKGGDWEGAAHTMALALECALKTAVCRTLRVEDYPETHKDKKVPDFFMTHSFERLKLLAGLSDLFVATGDLKAFDNWSSFTIQFPGEWTAMRYDPNSAPNPFTEILANKLMSNLVEDANSIINTITNKRRW